MTEPIRTTPLEVARRFVGVTEVAGDEDNHWILAWLTMDNSWPSHDEVPWCSAFMQVPFFILRLPRSRDLRARSWLNVGREISLDEAEPGFDVVILKRGVGDQPGPDVIDAPGHVGLFVARGNGVVTLLGGNQGDQVRESKYLESDVIGVRRVA